MHPVAQVSGVRSLTPDELRTRLATPFLSGNKKEFLHEVVGSLTEEEADAFERRINAMNEQMDKRNGPVF